MDRPSPPPQWLPPVPAADPPAPAAPPPASQQPEPEQSALKRALGPLFLVVALVAKFGKVAFVAVKGLKFLTTSATMLVSVAAYALIWGWKFAVGFVLLLLVHEYGHVLQLRREGIKASAPIFIPFMGALIWAKSLGKDAVAEARVGLAGPILGSLGAAVCMVIGFATDEDFWKALAFTGFFLNLFNLLPLGFLDGARAAAAMSPWMWLVGVFGAVVLTLTFPNPIIVLLTLLGIWETYRRFKDLRSGDPQITEYYRVSPRNRLLVAAVYLGLIALLVLGMDATHIERDFDDV
ncbi:site-2 protease family protein [Conexibacter sp. SYSU D00693]|uniref:site-2 protease family protein n=1 Tax=Conexibacter sp. SYSU D00693 TaxID=2812560 RepID=UPI00196B3A38|nr:site-2 protease family protein [Conexibacter sp. SYSU D00693]